MVLPRLVPIHLKPLLKEVSFSEDTPLGAGCDRSKNVASLPERGVINLLLKSLLPRRKPRDRHKRECSLAQDPLQNNFQILQEPNRFCLGTCSISLRRVRQVLLGPKHMRFDTRSQKDTKSPLPLAHPGLPLLPDRLGLPNQKGRKNKGRSCSQVSLHKVLAKNSKTS